MALETLALGEHILGKDGMPLGHVTRFVVDSASARLIEVVVGRGPLSTERIFALNLVDRTAGGELVAPVDQEEAKRLPPVPTREVEQEPGADVPVVGFTWDPYEGEGVVNLAHDSLSETPPSPDVIVETASTFPESSVVLSKHTEVVSADGFKAGHLHALLLDGEQQLVGIVTTSGLVYKHNVRVPLTAIASLARKRIVLTQGLDDALNSLDEADVQPA